VLSTDYKFIFIHIPKTGGNSIHNALRPYSEDVVICNSKLQDGIERFETTHTRYNISKHSTLQDYLNELPAEITKHYTIFTCIRNPWERMISYYFSPHRQVSEWSRELFIEMLDKEVKNSAHYVTPMESDKHQDIHFIRFEQLSDDFQNIRKKLQIPQMPRLPHYNKSHRSDYRHYYDNELVQLVEERSKFEIDTFGYTF